MASRYTPFTLAQFTEVMDRLGFNRIEIAGTHEYVFERAFEETRFSIRIYSSITVGTSVTRECGADAIRITIFDRKLGKQTYSQVVHRTQNALTNLVTKAREAHAYKNAHKCTCGSLMVERSGKGRKFLGCTAFPECKQTRQVS
jgi:hypothetical protein